MLDIIVAHYNEPWEVCEKFFTMLRMQRGADFNQIRVLLIHDGTQYFNKKLFKGIPYRLEQHWIKHGGISAVRNEGIRISSAEWIMFCDIDDVFTNIYALRDWLHVLPAPNYDMIWAPFISEDALKDGRMILHERNKRNVVFIHGKVFRRQFLIDHNIRFDTDLTFNEDSLFGATFEALADYKRIGKLNSLMLPYSWCFREGSATATASRREEAMRGSYERNKKLCEVHRKYLPEDRYAGQVTRTVWDAYHSLNTDNPSPEVEAMREDFKDWYKEHKQYFGKVSPEIHKQIIAISRAEHETGCKEGEARWDGWNDYKCKYEIPIDVWLKGLEEDV